jgi:hypothetical protein
MHAFIQAICTCDISIHMNLNTPQFQIIEYLKSLILIRLLPYISFHLFINIRSFSNNNLFIQDKSIYSCTCTIIKNANLNCFLNYTYLSTYIILRYNIIIY